MSVSSSELAGEGTPVTTGPSRARFAVALIAVLVAAGILVPRLSTLATETRRFAELDLRDSGRIPRPLPEALAIAARRALRAGETWSLHTPTGGCPREERLFWLAFRLMPNVADCAAPDVSIYWGIPAPAGPAVVASGRGFVIVRP